MRSTAATVEDRDTVKGKGFHRFDEIRTSFEQLLETSVADETELVWFERRSARVASEGDPGELEDPRLTVLVRVVEGGRQGLYRTDTADANLLESGIRQALAMAKVRQKLKKSPQLLTDSDELRAPRRLFDREVSRLDPVTAREYLDRLVEQGDDAAWLSWTDSRLVIYNNHGLRRSAASTELTLEVRSGDGPGAGRAAASARRLADLDSVAVRERARAAAAPADAAVGELPEAPVPVLLAPEAAVTWLNVLNAHAFSGRSFLDGTSFLARHRNIQVFDRKVNLYDDGTDPAGLEFPFDFEGSAKRRLELIDEGKPSTPALSQVQGLEAGLEPTAQAVGGHDAFFCNLFLAPGETAEVELLAAADGGIRVGWLETPECYEPEQLKVRAVARGVRRIEGGELGAPLPDFVWEESLLRALARLRAVGDSPVLLATATTPLGGISAPALVLEEATQGFRPIA